MPKRPFHHQRLMSVLLLVVIFIAPYFIVASVKIETDFLIILNYGPSDGPSPVTIPFQTLTIEMSHLQTEGVRDLTKFTASICKPPLVPWRAPDCIERVQSLLQSVLDGTATYSKTATSKHIEHARVPRFDLTLTYPMWYHSHSINGVNHTLIYGPPSPDTWPCPISKDPLSLNSAIDSAALTMNIISSHSTDKAFQSSSLTYVRSSGPVKGRGVYASSALLPHTPLELSPSLLLPSSALWLRDRRHHRDALPSPLNRYAYPMPKVPGYSLVVLGNAMLYNHCDNATQNMNWEILREEVLPPKIIDDWTRHTAFYVRFFTTKDVKAFEELCWNYGDEFWTDTEAKPL